MLRDCEFHKIIDKIDCLGLDGGYTLIENQIIEKYKENGCILESKNFWRAPTFSC